MRRFALLTLCCARAGWAQAPDSLKIYRAAEDAEVAYERAARHLAPLGTSDNSGTCDEYVGRFCLYYDTDRDPLPTEPREIARFRQKAIEKLRAAAAINPARRETVLPLVRLLVEQKEPDQAGLVVEAFRRTSSDIATGSMLAVFVANGAGEITRAEAAIAAWQAATDSVERRRREDILWLLDSAERKRYRALTAAARRRYEARFWRYADALYLTEGNETRVEHFARHAESRLVAAAPIVVGGTSWGNDVAQLTIRFGTPKARTRLWPTRFGSTELALVEHWDPEQLIYAPPALDSVLRLRARPGMGWPLDTVRSISGHAPSTIRRMMPLEHQATVFRNADGGHVLRVDGVIAADSAARGATHVRRGLFLLDEDLEVVGRVGDEVGVKSDTLRLALEMDLPEKAALYSAELLESRSRLAARARFRLERPQPDGALYLSDVMIAEPFPAGRLPASRSDPVLNPKGSLILGRGEAFGVYAEVSQGQAQADSVTIDLEVIALDGSPALVRAARWLGRRLGLADRPAPQRLSWVAEIPDDRPAPIAVTIEPGQLRPGRYIVELSVSSRGRRASSRREIVFSVSETSLPRP